MNEPAFTVKRLVQDAVAWNLTVIGEAAAMILSHDPDFADGYPGLPLRRARGMRNRIAHGYDSIDHHIVWFVVADELPGMLEHARRAKAALNG